MISNPIPGHISRENWNSKKYMHLYVHSSTIHNSQDREATQMSINRGKKMWYISTMEYYSAIKKNEIMPFAERWMDIEISTLSEVSQINKD